VPAYAADFNVATLGEEPVNPSEDGESDVAAIYTEANVQAWAGMALAFAFGRYIAVLQWFVHDTRAD